MPGKGRAGDAPASTVALPLNAGFSAPIVMALGGWKTERMMRRYAAVTDTTLRRAAEAVSGNEGQRLFPSAIAGAAAR
jgi:hypothetical protein